MEANALAGDQSIEVPEGHYLLTIEESMIKPVARLMTDTTGTLTIVGTGSQNTVIDANQLDRVIHVFQR